MSITNTKNNPRYDWVLGGNPAAIESQEARGQMELIDSEQLPVKVEGDRKKLEDKGVVFGKPTPGDEIFCSAKLPVGWKKRPTDHSMWSELVDEKGAVCAKIFYKAAFYDRSAFIRIVD